MFYLIIHWFFGQSLRNVDLSTTHTLQSGPFEPASETVLAWVAHGWWSLVPKEVATFDVFARAPWWVVDCVNFPIRIGCENLKKKEMLTEEVPSVPSPVSHFSFGSSKFLWQIGSATLIRTEVLLIVSMPRTECLTTCFVKNMESVLLFESYEKASRAAGHLGPPHFSPPHIDLGTPMVPNKKHWWHTGLQRELKPLLWKS